MSKPNVTRVQSATEWTASVLNTARHLGRMAGLILAELTTKSSKQSQLSVFQVFLWNFVFFCFFF